jgi:hypothetical protein
MDITDKTLSLTKAGAAYRQTEAAIEAFVRGDFDIAITLAGAAEGTLDRDGPHMFPFLRDTPRVKGVPRKDWIATLNMERDWLKHTSGPEQLTLGHWEAAFMIARAMSKLEKWTPRMEEFKEWLVANIETL